MSDLWIDHLQLSLPLRHEQRLNERLYGAIREAILTQVFAPGARLPASRTLADGLGISRNTVTRVFDQLLIEGFVTTRIGAGTFVSVLEDPGHSVSATSPQATTDVANDLLSQRGQRLVEHSSAAVHQWGAFMPGVPDVRLFPSARLQRDMVRLARTATPTLYSYPGQGGDPLLREALAQHLNVTRGVRCDPRQILIVEGAHQGLDLITRLLTDPGDLAWVEEPGYWGIRRLLDINSVVASSVPVDGEGMCIDAQAGPSPRLIFTTPSHHYPLGSVMSIQRRRQLLAYARTYQSLIIEDDYDSEFRYTSSPVPALQGLEPDAPVIYVGTFSKTIYPGLRIAYLVLPKNLLGSFERAYLDLHRGGHGLLQRALGEFIQRGDYARHIRRVRGIYGRRRDYLASLIETRFGADMLPLEARDSAGLHLTLPLPQTVDDSAITQRAAERQVLVRPLSRYYQTPNQQRGLLLGYACVAEDEMDKPFNALAECMAL